VPSWPAARGPSALAGARRHAPQTGPPLARPRSRPAPGRRTDTEPGGRLPRDPRGSRPIAPPAQRGDLAPGTPYKADPILTFAPPATTGFHTFPLAPQLLRAIEALGFTEARPIQRATLHAALAGRDVLGLAQTGTGKTAAFALPILQHLLDAGPARRRAGRDGKPAPSALVVAPTRELAAQIQAELTRLARFTDVRSTTLFGGVGFAPQLRALRARPDVVVACPGRLLDLVRQGALSLGAVGTLVLDEADHMFDMGFLPDLRRILALLPARRQNLLFSATMPREVRGLADQALRSPHVAELAHQRPPETISHALCPVAEGDKVAVLERLLRSPEFRSAIVFLRTKRRAKKLAERLERRGFRAVALQGNLSQARRERAMAGFRAGEYDILVATDIAARGIDVARVSHVVNFDLPSKPEHYTHRIGRTGRAQESGCALSFATPDDAASVRAIERHLGVPLARSAGGAPAGDAKATAPQRARRRAAPAPRVAAARPFESGLGAAASDRPAGPATRHRGARRQRQRQR